MPSNDIVGVKAMQDKIRKIAVGFPMLVKQALYAEAQIELTEAKRRTPFLTGALRGSGIVEPPVQSGNTLSVTIAFGGPAADYAVYVHENLEAHHPVGQAKFLESTLLESAPYLMDRIGKRLDVGSLL